MRYAIDAYLKKDAVLTSQGNSVLRTPGCVSPKLRDVIYVPLCSTAVYTPCST